MIYLDGAANTPLDPDVFKAMKKYLKRNFVGNSMAIHKYGIEASRAIEQSRKEMAEILRVEPEEIIFTSGASESNNQVVQSFSNKILFSNYPRKSVICCGTEHTTIYHCCQEMSDKGVNISFIPPNSEGGYDLENVQNYLNDDVALLCLMAVNNETGVANNVKSITRYAAQLGIKTLVDCTQVVSNGGHFLELGINYPDATYFSFSAHKFYGPTGCGCLVAREKGLLTPLIFGGAQEYGLRAGTMNTAGIVGMAEAFKKAHDSDYNDHFRALFFYLRDSLSEKLPLTIVNAWPTYGNIVSLNFKNYFKNGIDSLAQMLSEEVGVSAGSACDSQHDEAAGEFNGSHVLLALGLTEEEIRATIRVSFTKYNTYKDIDGLIKSIQEIIEWTTQEQN